METKKEEQQWVKGTKTVSLKTLNPNKVWNIKYSEDGAPNLKKTVRIINYGDGWVLFPSEFPFPGWAKLHTATQCALGETLDKFLIGERIRRDNLKKRLAREAKLEQVDIV